MTDEEMAEEFANKKCKECYMCSYSEHKNPYKICQRRKDRKQAFLAGLKAGKDMAETDLATVAYMHGAERCKTKWHKVADGDLPSEEGGWVCNQDGLPCYFDWSTEQWLDCEGTQIRTTEWCHMPHKE